MLGVSGYNYFTFSLGGGMAEYKLKHALNRINIYKIINKNRLCT